MRSILCIVLMLLPGASWAEETFMTIQQVRGNQIAVVKDAVGGGRRGGAAAASQPTVLTVPADAKITTAMRERRTFEFRVGGELAGGLQHGIFREMKGPLSARIVTEGNRITEINVITPQIDINQSQTDASGQTVIAIRPKRPPLKKK
ncbi:hypothetical protein ETAA8_59450 [Anatilimnocola aggregata]|uniref:Uncharacterized protein n=1 Tax=Anatilimnocola aggregata TaxID=2528021 RepID=A0A517YKP2_9BACT|nr:hypothetical protein [Anatilimnocola aggregata]QDU30796.1 hypothetical protein ETAA8_59450 [Anatilimnocola aggregata]